jgi:hypothetical protein
MKKVLIIGNSHAGTVRRAFEKLPQNTFVDLGIDITTCAIQFLHDNLYYEKGLLRTNDGNTSYYLHRDTGKHHINLNDFELILSYGGGLMSNPVAWNNHVLEFISGRYSGASIKQSHIDCIENSAVIKMLSPALQTNTGKYKIVCIPSPVPNQLHWQLKNINAMLPDYMDFVETIYAEYFSKRDIGFAPLPRELIAENGFAVDKRFKKETAEDFIHLSDLGGAIVAKHIIETIKTSL